MNGRVVVVTAVGAARGSRAAAAALACAASEPDQAALLIEVGARPPRPTLLASSGARELEERLAAHLPGLRAASRGQTCHLAVPPGEEGREGLRAALPLVRDPAAVIHAPPRHCRELLEASGVEPSGILLRADLREDRALTALAVNDLRAGGALVRVLKHRLAWVPARRALFGVLPPESPGGLPCRLRESLLESQISAAHACYAGEDDEEIDPEGAAQQQRRGDAGPGRRGGLHRHPERQAGR